MQQANQNFTIALLQEIFRNVYNYHVDNVDVDRSGFPSFFKSAKNSIKKKIMSALYKCNLTYFDGRFDKVSKKINELEYVFPGVSRLYDHLKDDYSRELLVKLFAYRILGRERVKLPLNNKAYWQKRKQLNTLISKDKTIPINFMDWSLSDFKLKGAGYDIELFNIPLGIQAIFILKQYEYDRSSVICKPQKGDIVIDGGACWGDSALYFAHEVGSGGKVYSFEFIPSNIKIMKTNFDLNQHLKNQIEIIENPLWDTSAKTLYCVDNGPASRISEKPPEDSFTTVSTISIDNFVTENNIERIDFIKMDIEGAEENALRGAQKTIEKFRPKLAISLYHELDHFSDIPDFLSSLNFAYDFFLDHYTIHLEETVLYAIPHSRKNHT